MRWKAWLIDRLAELTWRRCLYAFIAGATPLAAFLGSSDPITSRKLAAVFVGALVAAATADRAYIDPSHGGRQ